MLMLMLMSLRATAVKLMLFIYVLTIFNSILSCKIMCKQVVIGNIVNVFYSNQRTLTEYVFIRIARSVS